MPARRLPDGIRLPASSRLFDLDQRAAKILRVQEQHRLAVGADLRLAVAEHARALRLEPLPRGADIVDLVTEVMNAATGIAVEEVCDRRRLPQRLEAFDLGVGRGD